MSYTALARKWRPGKFSEVIGQEHVVAALSNSLKNQRIHHAFLFTGTRGVGKTTLARIFAKALNCENGINVEPCCQCRSCISIEQGRFVDLIEVDAASRTKVDDTRDLLDNVQYKPTQGRYKVYLIDEVHMLSMHSFNALLKTLEEPPEHVKFLLATTDPKKLPATVLSRCIQFNLKSMDLPLLTSQLKLVCQYEKVQCEQNALSIIARAANGSVRDALSLLDQAIAYSDAQITQVMVREMLGMIEQHYIEEILQHLAKSNATGLFKVVEDIATSSADYMAALDDLLTWLHHISLYQFTPEALSWKSVDVDKIALFAPLFSADELQLYYQIGVSGKRDLGSSPDARTGFEMLLLRMLAFKPAADDLNSVDNLSAQNQSQGQDGRSQPELRSVESPKQRIVRPAISRQPDSDGSENASQLSISSSQSEVVSHVADKKTVQSNQKQQIDSNLAGFASSEDAKQATSATFNDAMNEIPSTPAQLVDPMQWITFVSKADFGGVVKQIVMNMQPFSFENGCLSLYLDKSCAQLLNAERQAKIAQNISAFYASQVKIAVELEELPENAKTPAKYQQQASKARLDEAKQAIVKDDDVQELINLFDAQIDESSIRPGES